MSLDPAPSEAQQFESVLSDLISRAPLVSVSIAALAFVVSVAALLTAISSRVLAGKSYALAKSKEDRQATMLDLEVIETLQTILANGDRVIQVELRITNRSEVAASLRGANLWLAYKKQGDDHTTEVAPVESGVRSPSFPLPTKLDSRSTEQGWLRFEMPSHRTAGWTILSFDLVVTDTDSRVFKHEGLSVKRVYDEA